MATIKKFEELEIWRLARAFSLKIYNVTADGTFSRDWSLKNQINESTGSVMDNIAEGFERGGNKEFINFLSYAKGSAGESKSQLYRALDRRHITPVLFDELREEATILGSKIGKLMEYLKNSGYRGNKFMEPEEHYRNDGDTKMRQVDIKPETDR